MKPVEKKLIAVLRLALWDKALPLKTLSTEPFQQLCEIASKQACVGLVCKAFLDSGVELNKYDAAFLLMTLGKVDESNRKVTHGLHRLAELLNDHGIPFFVVKGQLVGTSYLHPECRMSGDVDFYVPPSHFDHARQLIADEWKVDYDEGDSDEEQHIAFTKDGVAFEMHYTLLKFYNSGNRDKLECLLAEDMHQLQSYTVVDKQVPGLPYVDNLFYTFLHLFHHLTELGVGLRQFCDIAYLLYQHEWSDAERLRLQSLLQAFDFYKGFQAVCAVCVDMLDLDEAYLPFSLKEQDHRYVAPIMRVVFEGGNFGFYAVKSKVRSGWRYNLEALKGKLRRYRMFYHLAPKEIRSCFFLELPAKMKLVLRRY